MFFSSVCDVLRKRRRSERRQSAFFELRGERTRLRFILEGRASLESRLSQFNKKLARDTREKITDRGHRMSQIHEKRRPHDDGPTLVPLRTNTQRMTVHEHTQHYGGAEAPRLKHNAAKHMAPGDDDRKCTEGGGGHTRGRATRQGRRACCARNCYRSRCRSRGRSKRCARSRAWNRRAAGRPPCRSTLGATRRGP